jgi:hypothetical protein
MKSTIRTMAQSAVTAAKHFSGEQTRSQDRTITNAKEVLKEVAKRDLLKCRNINGISYCEHNS